MSRRRDALRSLPLAGAAAVAALAPFEASRPVAALGGLVFSNLELLVALALALSALPYLAGVERPRLDGPLTRPALALLAALLLAAALAPEHAANAVRFCGRVAAGVGVMLLARQVARAPRGLATLCGVVSAAAGLVASVALLEALAPGPVAAALASFRGGPFRVGALTRSSATLQYPTVASMYLEIAFALALGPLLVARAASGRAKALAALQLLIAAGVVATHTRAGLAVLVAQLALTTLLHARRSGRLSPRLVGVGAVTAVALVALALGSETLRARLGSETERGLYRAEFTAPARLALEVGVPAAVRVVVANRGRLTWEPGETAVSYHWLDAAGERVLWFEGRRTPLPHRVAPGAAAELEARVEPPPLPGRYQLGWDVVEAELLWISSRDGLSALSEVEVTGAPVAGVQLPEGGALPAADVRFQPGRLALWGVALQMLAERPLLGHGPDSFRLVHGRYLGLERWNWTHHAHNTPLELLAGGGLLAGAALAWLALQVVASWRRVWREADAERWPFAIALAAVLVAIALHGLVDVFLQVTPTYLMIWLSLGLLAGADDAARAEHAAHGRSSTGIGIQ